MIKDFDLTQINELKELMIFYYEEVATARTISIIYYRDISHVNNTCTICYLHSKTKTSMQSRLIIRAGKEEIYTLIMPEINTLARMVISCFSISFYRIRKFVSIKLVIIITNQDSKRKNQSQTASSRADSRHHHDHQHFDENELLENT